MPAEQWRGEAVAADQNKPGLGPAGPLKRWRLERAADADHTARSRWTPDRKNSGRTNVLPSLATTLAGAKRGALPAAERGEISGPMRDAISAAPLNRG